MNYTRENGTITLYGKAGRYVRAIAAVGGKWNRETRVWELRDTPAALALAECLVHTPESVSTY